MTNIQNLFDRNFASRPPIWLMRQAGRYLPEYKKIRGSFSSFMDFCADYEAATEVTLQPIERFDFDAAIIFSDILTIPHAMGQDVNFIPNKGPILETISDWQKFANNQDLSRPETLHSTYQAITETRKALAQDKSLFGFAGAPWTLITYMLGKEGKDYSKVVRFAEEHSNLFIQIQEKLIKIIGNHLTQQIKAGADIVQIFDSWAAATPVYKRQSWVIEPIAKIVNYVHEQTKSPVIVFTKGVEELYQKIAAQVKRKDLIGFSLGPTAALTKPLKEHVLQGGLSPETLLEGGELLDKEARDILRAHADTPYIFNLGHGILPSTPISHVHQLIDIVRGL